MAEHTEELRARSLEELERVIERGIGTFVEVGRALLEIRDRRLYRERGYERIEDYCRERWGFARRTAYQYLDAAEVVCAIAHTDLPPPPNEAVARELVPLKDDSERLRSVWEESLRRAARGEEGVPRPTASIVATVRREMVGAEQAVGIRPEHGRRQGVTLRQTFGALQSLRVQVEGIETLFASGRLDRVAELKDVAEAREEVRHLREVMPFVVSRLRRLVKDWGEVVS